MEAKASCPGAREELDVKGSGSQIGRKRIGPQRFRDSFHSRRITPFGGGPGVFLPVVIVDLRMGNQAIFRVGNASS